MPPPTDASQPRLATGCRWGGTEENRVILYPEGALKLQNTGRQEFDKTDPEKIRADISIFLEQLQRKRIVDY
ncbi:MAG: hypothetical protein DMG78_26800 [Acidobacteria bacterium]|nr:MAG: hypothetical protein DMG78_26800 [Acidobacteriota bacterium]